MNKWINGVALVTGASSGIGKAISENLVKNGVKVVACARNIEALNNIKAELDNSQLYYPYKCDVSIENDILDLFSFISGSFGRLDICINNAGCGYQSSLLDGKTEDWTSMLNVNVLGLCICAREAAKLMEKSPKLNEDIKQIININSMSGHRVSTGRNVHFYTATKFVVTAVTEGLRQELCEKKLNIKIAQISPGIIETDFFRRMGGDQFNEQVMNSIDNAPLLPHDIVEAVNYILSTPVRAAVHDVLIRPTSQKS